MEANHEKFRDIFSVLPWNFRTGACIEFIRPRDGTVLIYNPDTLRVRVCPFGAGNFHEASLSPENPLIQSWRGTRMDQSDIGALLENICFLRKGGTTEILGEKNMGSRMALPLIVSGADSIVAANVHRSESWLDTTSPFPVKLISRDLRDV